MQKTTSIKDLFAGEPYKKGQHCSELHQSYFRIAGITVCVLNMMISAYLIQPSRTN